MTTTEPTRAAVTVKVGPRLVSLKAPAPRSITRRKDAAGVARRRLVRYTNGTSATPDGSRVLDLLWAQAMIQRALYAETHGRYGKAACTASEVLEDLEFIQRSFPAGAL